MQSIFVATSERLRILFLGQTPVKRTNETLSSAWLVKLEESPYLTPAADAEVSSRLKVLSPGKSGKSGICLLLSGRTNPSEGTNSSPRLGL